LTQSKTEKKTEAFGICYRLPLCFNGQYHTVL